MKQIHWKKPISGEFDAPDDWKGSVVPGASDGANLGAAGPADTVTSRDSDTVRSIQFAANATLAMISCGRRVSSGRVELAAL